MNQTLVSLTDSTNCEFQDFQLDHRSPRCAILLHIPLLAVNQFLLLQLDYSLMFQLVANLLVACQKCLTKSLFLLLLLLFIQTQINLMPRLDLFVSAMIQSTSLCFAHHLLFLDFYHILVLWM